MEWSFSLHAREVMKNRQINREWVLATIENPSIVKMIKEDEAHYYREIEVAENRCLKVVVNPKTQTVVTTYFDRKMRKKGCR